MKIIAAGGTMGEATDLISTVEYFNPYAVENRCDNRNDYPRNVTHVCGDKELFCGGYDNILTGQCYRLEGTKWTQRANLINPRSSGSCMYLSNSSFWIVGGQGGYSSSEMIMDVETGNVQHSSQLPGKSFLHCMARINQTHLFVAGNFYQSGENGGAYIVDTSNDLFNFHVIPDTNIHRYNAACGSFKDKDGNTFLIAAGGENASGNSPSTTTELYSVNEEIWIDGPYLPRGFKRGGYISDEDHPLILLGGYNEMSSAMNDVIEYNLESNAFEQLPGKLETPRVNFAASVIYTDEDC